MGDNTQLNLSKETKNRIFLWHHMIHKAYNYLIVDNTIELSESDYLDTSYDIDIKTHRITSKDCIKDALKESAIIWFCNIFTTGNDGVGIADNKKNVEISDFREKMKDYVVSKLSWERSKLDVFIKKVKDNRNKLIAHYDGSFANYQEIAPGQEQMKAPVVTLDYCEIQELREILKYMSEFIYMKA